MIVGQVAGVCEEPAMHIGSKGDALVRFVTGRQEESHYRFRAIRIEIYDCLGLGVVVDERVLVFMRR